MNTSARLRVVPITLAGANEYVRLHHRTYERLGEELLDDLEALCNVCHGQEHGISV